MIVVIDKEALKEDIARAGFSLTGLAKEVGCSKAHISSIINHERNPSARIAVKICEQLNSQLDKYYPHTAGIVFLIDGTNYNVKEIAE